MKKFTTLLLAAMFSGGILSAQTAPICEYGSPVSQQSKEHARTYAPARELSTVTPTPAPGLVNSIGEINLTFVGASIVELSTTTDDRMPRLIKADDSIILASATTVNGNQLTITFNPEVTEAGTYTLNVPRLGVRVDYGSLTTDLNFTYTVGKAGDSGIIYEAPAGETVKCQADFLSYFVVDGGLSGMPIAGKPLHYVLGEDGNLYLYNIMTIQPYGGQQTSSYIVGKPSCDNTWKFSFPQPIYETAENGEQTIWYLNYLYTYVDPTTGSAGYRPYEEDNSVEFMIDEEGNAVWLSGNEDPNMDNGYAIGATRPDGSWTGFANLIRSTYQKFTDEAPDINPHEYEIWKLTTGSQGQRVSRNVGVFF